MIVHIITGLNRGGAEHALYRLLTQEADPTCVRVVSLTDGGIFQARLAALGIQVVCLQMRAGLPSPLKWWRLVRLLRAWRPCLVQTWMYHADLLGGLASWAARVPVCWGVRHSDLSREGNKATTLLVAHLCAWISRWVPVRAISCSARAVDIHRALGYSVPFTVVPNGLDVTAWLPQAGQRSPVRAALALPAHAFVFAHAGRNDPQKDHATLARAFSMVHAARPNARLLLCGQGLLPGHAYFEHLPFTPGARAAVLALGPRDDLPQLWPAADVFVLSSYGEAFPNVVAEAMACGLPAVVTDVGDAAEIVGETGKVVPPMNEDALAQAMLDLMRMPDDERQRLGTAARERVQTRFTLERMSAGFRRVWDEVLAEDGQRCAD